MSFQIDYFYRWNERIVRPTQGGSGSEVSGDGAISDIIDVNLAPSRLLVSSAAGKIVVSSVLATEAATLLGIDTGTTIQAQLDDKQDSLTIGNLTESTSSVLTINGGTGSIIGSGLSIEVKLAGVAQSGYLSSTDWNTFNNKRSNSLAVGYVWIGDGSAQAVDSASLGDIGATVGGGLAIKSTVISNTHIASGAAITRTKLANGTAYRILANNISGVISENAALTAGFAIISDANGQLTISPTTALRLSYISTATSDLQVQINTLLTGKATNSLVQSPTASEDGFAITWDNAAQEYKLSDPVVQGIPNAGSTSQVLMKDSGSDYDVSWTSLLLTHISDISALAADVNVLVGADANGVTTDIISYLGGATPITSSVQNQLNSKLSNGLSPGALFYGNASGVASQLSATSDGWVLTLVSGFPQWQAVPGTGTVTSIDVSGGTTGLSFSGGPVTTSGTITLSGTLHADDGGTGFSVFTVGDILYADTTTTLAKLAATTNGFVLTLTGGVPVWAAATATVGDADYGNITVSGTGTVWTVDANINKAWTGTHSFLDNSWTLLDNLDNTKILAFQLSGITTGNTRTLTIPNLSGTIALLGGSGNGAALTKVDDTNVTLTLGGGPTTSLLTAASLTLGWTGQLAVTRGGTGLSSTAQGDILYADASNSLVALPKSASATRYLSNTGASNNPAWAQVDLTNGVTGVLPIANGGTGSASGASFWSSSTGATLTGANTITGTGQTLKFIYNSLGITQTNGYGAWFANTTAASLGSQQISPSIVVEGQGYATTPTNSQSVKFAIDLLPVQGVNNPSGNLQFKASIDGGAYTNRASISSDGKTILTGASTVEDVLQVGNTEANKLFFGIGRGTYTTTNNGFISWGTTLGGSSPYIQFSSSVLSFISPIVVSNQGSATGSTWIGGVSTGATANTAFAFRTRASLIGGGIDNTSNNSIVVEIGNPNGTNGRWNPSSGTGSFYQVSIVPDYNTSGAGAYTAIGVDYNPVLTSTTGLTHLAARFTSGSILLNGTTKGANTGNGVHIIENATTNASAAQANGIVLHAKDSSDAASTLALYLEQAVEATATFTQTHRIKVWINGVEYYLSLDAV